MSQPRRYLGLDDMDRKEQMSLNKKLIERAKEHNIEFGQVLRLKVAKL